MDEIWECSRCTLLNNGYSYKCEACRSPRPGVSRPHPVYHTYSQSYNDPKGGARTPTAPARGRANPQERRIVFLGRTGSGKSLSGNNILGKKIFESSASGSSVTKQCQRGTAVRWGRNIQIIDTPGLFDTGMTNADITREIVKCVGMTAPGPHAFVLVTRIDRFTKEEQDTVEHFMQIFGERMVNYLVVLFTRKDDLIHEGATLADYLQKVPEELRNLLQACNNRCIAFNNRGSDTEVEQDVKTFLNMVDGILQNNGGNCYTSDMFREAEIHIQRREAELRQENERKRREEREKIIKDYQKKMNAEDKRHEFERAQLQNRIKQLEDDKKKSTTDDKSVSQEISDLKSAMQMLVEERKKMAEDLEAERKRKEKEAEEEEEEDYRERTREEVNKEGPGVMHYLMKGVSFIASLALPAIFGKVAGAAGKGISKLLFRK